MCDPVKLTADVKQMAEELGIEMVAVASVDRFRNAPLMHSPQGLLPTAKSVVVVGVSWLDAAIELTEKELSEYYYNPSDQCESQTNMNERLYHTVFNLAKFLESLGYRSLPLPPTHYWRYRPYKTMREPFAPPLAHRYAAVAAGLGEIGWHESFLSPQYGPRQRLNSLITEAPLMPDPLYNGDPLCDKCMKCVTACPYDRYRKDVKGTKELDIGGKKITIPITNKWRCFLCYSGINPRFIPREITEEVALRITNDRRRRATTIMDSAACLAACMPPKLRTEEQDDALYPHSVARKMEMREVDARKAADEIRKRALEAGADHLYIGTKEELLGKGIDLDHFMPKGESLVLFGFSHSDSFMEQAARLKAKDLLFDLSHYAQSFGCRTLPVTRLGLDTMKEVFGIADAPARFQHFITALPLASLNISPETVAKPEKSPVAADEIKSFALAKGADLVGIASVNRLDGIHAALETALAGEKTIVAQNQGGMMCVRDINFVATGIEEPRRKRAVDHLPNARSVIVIGIHYPYAVMENVGKPPAEDVSTYRGMQEYFGNEFLHVAFDVVRFLKSRGFRAVPTWDLTDASFPRHTLNRFSAVAAGLGEPGWCGTVLTPQYGYAQRFVAIVTDADLEQDALYSGPKLCRECRKCAESCPVNAISATDGVCLEVEGRTFEFGRTDRLRCEWANKYGLIGEEGPANMGSKIDIPPPDEITLEAFADAMAEVRKLEPVERFNWDLTFEQCLHACPVTGTTAPR